MRAWSTPMMSYTLRIDEHADAFGHQVGIRDRAAACLSRITAGSGVRGCAATRLGDHDAFDRRHHRQDGVLRRA